MATVTLRPAGAGASTAIEFVSGAATHWEAVDEVTHDSDTTNVQEGGTGFDGQYFLDLYTIGANTIPAGSTINSVTVYAYCKSPSVK